ncbi:MAG: HD domain-containing protein [Actinomycetota bacterium]
MDHRRIVELAAGLDGDTDEAATLAARIDFLLEIDRLKTVIRRSLIVDGSRRENTAEHSWHLAMFAIVLAPYAPDGTDLARAVEMLLVHDIVEVDAGDTYIYDEVGAADKAEREEQAAQRLYGLLPGGEGDRLADLWREYEALSTPTARFAHAVDRLQPVLLNAASGGRSWLDNGIRHSQSAGVNVPVGQCSPLLGRLVEAVLGDGADAGLLIDDRG